ncbi:hypothetical protein PAF15_01230 [Weissella koreensis]|uniref:hypothetical protein n=1 Tax=Weissella koreensis TaxID=165096 RepID=UPI0022BA3088|nr:hypothetical protein [Weissella koreensis]MCZ9310599.1 hypothetical protein [Weissella koreensis]
MLEITKSTTMNANFNSDDGKQIAYFSASVSGTGNGNNLSMTIYDQELYDANKEAVRAAKVEFDKYVYGVEDEESAEKDVAKGKTK